MHPYIEEIINIRTPAIIGCSYTETKPRRSWVMPLKGRCRELLQKGSRKRRPKTHYFIRLSQVGIDDRAPFFSRQIRWAPPSFQWHNPGSAWFSLRVRASNYRWCPNIDNFLYVWMHKHARLRAWSPPYPATEKWSSIVNPRLR